MAASKDIADQRKSIYLRSNVCKGVIISCGKDICHFHAILCQSSSLIEANSLHSRTLYGLFALSSIDAVSVKPDQAEGISEIEENGQRCWETIGDEVEESEEDHDFFDIKGKHLIEGGSEKNEANNHDLS